MSAPPSIRDTFFEECEELLEALAEGLALMDAGQHDGETVNAVFRAVHSIKGGAGAFALASLVAFAHRFETLLDLLRSAQVALTPDVMHSLLRAADHLADQVEAARDDRAIDPQITQGALDQLNACLGAHAPSDDADDPGEDDPSFGFAAIPLSFDLVDSPAAEVPVVSPPSARFQIHLRPHAALYANGHDPALLFATLADLGTLTVEADLSTMPQGSSPDLAPALYDQAWLGWQAILQTDATLAQITEVFDFVDGLCDLQIHPMDAPPNVDPAPDLAPSREAAISPPALPQTRPPRAAEEESEARSPKPTLRVDLERVDRLINAVGELIINQAMIEQSVLDLALPSDAEVITHVEAYRLLARDLQEAVMAIRAQPVKPLFQRMSRIIREAADATGKSARLITLGETTEVDKTVVERLADPLTHMIRNAVDHGLESPEARRAAGKDPEGTIHLSAAHRSGSVVIMIRDDGSGLNRPRIRDKAVARGLIPPEAELSDTEIDNLLFLPGFSTAEKLSSLSGRGVGLDVVRNAVTALGGRVTISSSPGTGTEFTISLPLTLAVMDGMVISVAGQTMVIPIASVVETIRPAPSDLHPLGTHQNLLSMRGRFLPMIDVAQCLGFPARDPTQTPLLLLVETEQHSQCALIVDAVLDQRQVVIKGLDANYGAVPGISAATVLGDGQIALILDAEALIGTRHTAPARGPIPLNGVAHAPH